MDNVNEKKLNIKIWFKSLLLITIVLYMLICGVYICKNMNVFAETVEKNKKLDLFSMPNALARSNLASYEESLQNGGEVQNVQFQSINLKILDDKTEPLEHIRVGDFTNRTYYCYDFSFVKLERSGITTRIDAKEISSSNYETEYTNIDVFCPIYYSKYFVTITTNINGRNYISKYKIEKIHDAYQLLERAYNKEIDGYIIDDKFLDVMKNASSIEKSVLLFKYGNALYKQSGLIKLLENGGAKPVAKLSAQVRINDFELTPKNAYIKYAADVKMLSMEDEIMSLCVNNKTNNYSLIRGSEYENASNKDTYAMYLNINDIRLPKNFLQDKSLNIKLTMPKDYLVFEDSIDKMNLLHSDKEVKDPNGIVCLEYMINIKFNQRIGHHKKSYYTNTNKILEINFNYTPISNDEINAMFPSEDELINNFSNIIKTGRIENKLLNKFNKELYGTKTIINGKEILQDIIQISDLMEHEDNKICLEILHKTKTYVFPGTQIYPTPSLVKEEDQNYILHNSPDGIFDKKDPREKFVCVAEKFIKFSNVAYCKTDNENCSVLENGDISFYLMNEYNEVVFKTAYGASKKYKVVSVKWLLQKGIILFDDMSKFIQPAKKFIMLQLDNYDSHGFYECINGQLNSKYYRYIIGNTEKVILNYDVNDVIGFLTSINLIKYNKETDDYEIKLKNQTVTKKIKNLFDFALADPSACILENGEELCHEYSGTRVPSNYLRNGEYFNLLNNAWIDASTIKFLNVSYGKIDHIEIIDVKNSKKETYQVPICISNIDNFYKNKEIKIRFVNFNGDVFEYSAYISVDKVDIEFELQTTKETHKVNARGTDDEIVAKQFKILNVLFSDFYTLKILKNGNEILKNGFAIDSVISDQGDYYIEVSTVSGDVFNRRIIIPNQDIHIEIKSSDKAFSLSVLTVDKRNYIEKIQINKDGELFLSENNLISYKNSFSVNGLYHIIAYNKFGEVYTQEILFEKYKGKYKFEITKEPTPRINSIHFLSSANLKVNFLLNGYVRNDVIVSDIKEDIIEYQANLGCFEGDITLEARDSITGEKVFEKKLFYDNVPPEIFLKDFIEGKNLLKVGESINYIQVFVSEEECVLYAKKDGIDIDIKNYDVLYIPGKYEIKAIDKSGNIKEVSFTLNSKANANQEGTIKKSTEDIDEHITLDKNGGYVGDSSASSEAKHGLSNNMIIIVSTVAGCIFVIIIVLIFVKRKIRKAEDDN